MDRLTWSSVTAALLPVLFALPAYPNDTTVAVTEARQQTHYSAIRQYAGRTVPRRSAALAFRHGGAIAELHVDAGVEVATGDLLASLDTASFAARVDQADADAALADANLAALRADVELARQTEQRFRRLHESGHLSTQRYDEYRLSLTAKRAQLRVAAANLKSRHAALAAARITLEETQIKAPFDGVIQSRELDEGAQVAPGEPVLRLVEIGQFEVHVGIPERFALALETGTDYPVVWQNTELAGRLRTTLPEVDPQTRTVTAIFDLDPAQPIPLGAVVAVNVVRQVESPGYWLPLSALNAADRGLWSVYVVNDQATLERRVVEVVHTETDRAYVRGSIEPGDRVVMSGVQRVVAGQRVIAAQPVAGVPGI